MSDPNSDIKNNAVLSLRIISELPDGFLKTIEIIHDKLTLLEDVLLIKQGLWGKSIEWDMRAISKT